MKEYYDGLTVGPVSQCKDGATNPKYSVSFMHSLRSSETLTRCLEKIPYTTNYLRVVFSSLPQA